MNEFIYLFIGCLICYLVGSISFGTIITKFYNKIDITKEGSGNPGATNVLRSSGAKSALIVLFLDMIKSIIPVIVVSRIVFTDISYIPHVCAASVVIGHCYPVFHNFKGGKGIATSIGPLFILSPAPALIAIFIFFPIALITRLVSLGSILGTIFSLISLIVFSWMGLFGSNWVDLLYLAPASTVCLVNHKENLIRLINGNENKLTFKKKNGN